MIYQSNNKYPIPKVERPNLQYAKILLDDFAGVVSEDTAINLYLYQTFSTNNTNPSFAEIMKKISEVEMHHLYLLGETIVLLGGNPIYGSFGNDNVLRLWNSATVNYTTNFKEMLETNIIAEQTAINHYQEQLKIIKDRYIQTLIKRIIEDELIHLSIFKELYKKNFILR